MILPTTSDLLIVAGYNILSNSLGSCAASRAHTYRNPGRNNFDMSDIDTAIALSSLASTPSKTAPLPLQFPLASWPGLLPLCLLPPNRFRLLLPPLPPLQKFPRIGARERGGDKTARGVARKPAKWKKKKKRPVSATARSRTISDNEWQLLGQGLRHLALSDTKRGRRTSRLPRRTPQGIVRAVSRLSILILRSSILIVCQRLDNSWLGITVSSRGSTCLHLAGAFGLDVWCFIY